jgi:hypothetical protein
MRRQARREAGLDPVRGPTVTLSASAEVIAGHCEEAGHTGDEHQVDQRMTPAAHAKPRMIPAATSVG